MATKIYSRFKKPPSTGLAGFSPTRTQQHFKDEADINKIVQRALNTGDATVFTTTQRAQYYDASTFEGYQEALNHIADIEDDFYSLPSKIRQEFGNNPDTYVEFMTNPDNVQKAIELGLLEGSGKETPLAATNATEQPAVAPPEASSSGSEPAGHSSS
ncbi:hypothetical protein AAEU41_03270 [Pantoea agglomerans]